MRKACAAAKVSLLCSAAGPAGRTDGGRSAVSALATPQCRNQYSKSRPNCQASGRFFLFCAARRKNCAPDRGEVNRRSGAERRCVLLTAAQAKRCICACRKKRKECTTGPGFEAGSRSRLASANCLYYTCRFRKCQALFCIIFLFLFRRLRRRCRLARICGLSPP